MPLDPTNILSQQLIQIGKEAIAIMPQLIVALLILALTYAASKGMQALLRTLLSRTKLRSSLKGLFLNLTAIGVWLFGLMVAAIVIFPNLTPTNALAGLGLGSVAIGFAFKDVFENFLAGIIILFRREMRIGDHIECQGLEGKVEQITIRETHIRQTDGQLVITPNAMLFKNPLTIRTDLDQRRITIICGVAYKEDIDNARSVITEALGKCDSVISDGRPVQVFAREFGASSVDFEVTWWTGSAPIKIRESKDQVIGAVKSALDNAGIEIPFPYRTMSFPEPLRIETSDLLRQEFASPKSQQRESE